MGSWDELCLICGISPVPPQEIWTDPEYEITEFVEQLLEVSPGLFASTSLASDSESLEQVLLAALDNPPYGIPPLFDDTVWRWNGFTDCVAVGHFLDDGDVPHKVLLDDENASDPGIIFKRQIPNGIMVQSRMVRSPNCGEFSIVVERTGGQMIESEQLSRTSSSNYLYPQLARQDGFGNFFLSKGCFNYVQNWVDWDSLPICEWRSKQLNFQEELYEVVNSRERGRVNGVGILAWMDYDGIENTLDQTQYTFAGGLKSYANTLAAIQENALPEVLHAAIIKDYRCWMFHVPNMWPMYPTNERSGNVLVLDTSHHPQSSTLPRSNSGLTSLPIELLYEILIHLAGLSGYFQISALSKYLRSILCEPTFYSRVLRGMLTHPGRCLYWVLPLTSIPKEAERAKDAMNSWIDAEDRQTKVNWNQSSFILKLIDPEFPLAAFVKACFSSDSMMNRKRIWGQVKQLEEVWRDYRLNGWRIDRFGVEI